MTTDATNKLPITQEQLDEMPRPTLEDILAFVNGGNYDQFFLPEPVTLEDGSQEVFTEIGAEAYNHLTALLYAVDRCTDMSSTYIGGYTVNDMVERLDEMRLEQA